MRLIIDNRTALPEVCLLPHVQAVLKAGLISDNGNSYCYVTTFKGGIVVSSNKTKTGHRFVIRKEEGAE